MSNQRIVVLDTHKEEGKYRVIRFVWYVFYFIETLLGIRFALKLLSANPDAWFSQLVYGISGIFVAPFQYVFSTISLGGSTFELSTLLAMAVYWVFTWGIVKLIAMNREVDSYEVQESLERTDEA